VKRFLNLVLCTVITMMFAVGAVNASDLSSTVEMGKDGLGGKITYSATYDKDKDVTKALVTLKVDDQSIETILNQTPGIGSTLSIFYFSNAAIAGNGSTLRFKIPCTCAIKIP